MSDNRHHSIFALVWARDPARTSASSFPEGVMIGVSEGQFPCLRGYTLAELVGEDALGAIGKRLDEPVDGSIVLSIELLYQFRSEAMEEIQVVEVEISTAALKSLRARGETDPLYAVHMYSVESTLDHMRASLRRGMDPESAMAYNVFMTWLFMHLSGRRVR